MGAGVRHRATPQAFEEFLQFRRTKGVVGFDRMPANGFGDGFLAQPKTVDAGAGGAELVNQIQCESLGISHPDEGRQPVEEKGAVAELPQADAEAGEWVEVTPQKIGVARLQFQRLRQQQPLAGSGPAGLQLRQGRFKKHSLMRRVLVHEHEAAIALPDGIKMAGNPDEPQRHGQERCWGQGSFRRRFEGRRRRGGGRGRGRPPGLRTDGLSSGAIGGCGNRRKRQPCRRGNRRGAQRRAVIRSGRDRRQGQRRWGNRRRLLALLGPGVVGDERFADGLGHAAADGGLVAESHFAFLRVDVDVDRVRIDVEKEAADRMPAFHQRVVIAFGERPVEAPVFDRSPVDEDSLFVPRGAADPGGADESPNVDQGFRRRPIGGIGEPFRRFRFPNRRFAPPRLELDGRQRCVAAAHLAQALPERFQRVRRARRGQFPDGAGIADKGECDVRVSCGGQRGDVLDVRQFGGLGPQEFPPRRQIKKEVSDLHLGARRSGACPGLDDAAAVDHDARGFSRGVAPFAGDQRETAHAGNAGERFTPKAEGRDCPEVFRRPQLACRVAFEAEKRVVAAHTESVVGDADQGAAPASDFDGDP